MEEHYHLTIILSFPSSGLIQVNRSLSRLAAVFVTFDQSNIGANPAGYREFNNFKHLTTIEAQLQIGSKKFPEMKMNSTQEIYAKLRDTCRDLKQLVGKKASLWIYSKWSNL